jgi:hypothetical protein
MATVAVRSSDADVVADLASRAGEAEAVAREATRLRDQLLEDRSVSEVAARAVAAPGLRVVLDGTRQSIGYAGETVGELSAAVTEARAARYHPHLLPEGSVGAEATQAGLGDDGGDSGR